MSQPPAERKYNYKDHRDISSEMIDYLLSVADVLIYILLTLKKLIII